MSSTNKTTNLELSQFIGSDSPKWLTDYNADMEKIDAGYQTVKAQSDATDLVVGGHTSSISTLQSTVTDQGTAITDLRTDVNGNSGSINTINSLIGNGEPTTTDKTLIGAINELNSDIGTLTNNVSTKLVLATTPVIKLAEVTADGVKTNSELLAELRTALIAAIENASPSDIYINFNAGINGVKMPQNSLSFKVGGDNTFAESFINTNIIGSDVVTTAIFLGASPFYSQSVNGTITNLLSTVPASGTTYTMRAEHYIKL